MPLFWKKIRHQLESWSLQLVTFLLPKLPHEGGAALARVVGALLFELDAAGRAVAVANLRAAFGDTLLPSQREAIARQSLQNFALVFFDLFWAQNRTVQGLSKLVKLTGFEAVEERMARGEPVIIMTHHFGNFEMAGQVMGNAGFALRIISEEVKNPAVTELFRKLHSSSGHQIIPQKYAVIRLLKGLKRGISCGFFVDFTLKLKEPGILINTFGLKKWVTPLQVVLAEKTGARLIPVVCLPMADGRLEVCCLPALEIPPGTSREEATQRCWDVFEPIIREHPEHWMWAYKHWRYKPLGDQRYPYYANSSNRFEALWKREK